jgi:hypothetical protein
MGRAISEMGCPGLGMLEEVDRMHALQRAQPAQSSIGACQVRAGLDVSSRLWSQRGRSHTCVARLRLGQPPGMTSWLGGRVAHKVDSPVCTNNLAIHLILPTTLPTQAACSAPPSAQFPVRLVSHTAAALTAVGTLLLTVFQVSGDAPGWLAGEDGEGGEASHAIPHTTVRSRVRWVPRARRAPSASRRSGSWRSLLLHLRLPARLC